MSTARTAPQEKPRLSTLGRWSLFWALFIGLGALLGVGMMWIVPDAMGMTPLLTSIQDNLPVIGSAFTSFLWPGICLLTIIGLPNLLGAVLIWRRRKYAPMWVIICGVILLGWIALQLLVVFGWNPVSGVYLVFAVTQVVTGMLWILRVGLAPSAE
jgi:hypothetical protein